MRAAKAPQRRQPAMCAMAHSPPAVAALSVVWATNGQKRHTIRSRPTARNGNDLVHCRFVDHRQAPYHGWVIDGLDAGLGENPQGVGLAGRLDDPCRE